MIINVTMYGIDHRIDLESYIPSQIIHKSDGTYKEYTIPLYTGKTILVCIKVSDGLPT